MKLKAIGDHFAERITINKELGFVAYTSVIQVEGLVTWFGRGVPAILCCNPHTSGPLLHWWLGFGLDSVVVSRPFYVAIITAMIYSCTGGLAIGVDSVVVCRPFYIAIITAMILYCTGGSEIGWIQL